MNERRFSPAFLRAVVDALLPGLPADRENPSLPAASQAGVDQKLAGHLERDPHREQIAAALAAIKHQTGGAERFTEQDEPAATAILEIVERTHPAEFAALVIIVKADYYETPAVLRAFGWRAGPPQPGGYTLPPFDEHLLAAVKQKQGLWRHAPVSVQK